MSLEAGLVEPEQMVTHERMVIHTWPALQIDDEQLFQFCQINRDLQIERTTDGDIIVMAPEGGSSGVGSSKLTNYV